MDVGGDEVMAMIMKRQVYNVDDGDMQAQAASDGGLFEASA
jgi:hypothetical protein